MVLLVKTLSHYLDCIIPFPHYTCKSMQPFQKHICLKLACLPPSTSCTGISVKSVNKNLFLKLFLHLFFRHVQTTFAAESCSSRKFHSTVILIKRGKVARKRSNWGAYFSVTGKPMFMSTSKSCLLSNFDISSAF